MVINRRRVMSLVLIVSLGLNLLIVGGITARVLSRPDGRPIPPNLSWIVNNLDEATADRLQPIVEEYGAAARPLRGAIFRAQWQINQLITEEPMNKVAIDEAFDDLRKAGLEYQELSHNQTTRIRHELYE